MLKTKLLSLMSACGIVATGIVGVATPANASSEVDAAISEARSFLTEYGADTATQDHLITKYLDGGTWDSMTRTSTPLSTVQTNKSDGNYTINTYADGSIQVVRIGAPDGGDQVGGISGCSVNGFQFDNCKIDTWVGLISLSFYASYNVLTNRITAGPWGPAYTIGGACGTEIIYFGSPVYYIAQMNVQAHMCGIPYTTTFELRLTITQGKAIVSWG